MDGSPAGPAAAIGLHVVTDDGNRCGCDAYDGLWMPSSACSNRREGGCIAGCCYGDVRADGSTQNPAGCLLPLLTLLASRSFDMDSGSP